MLNKDYYQTVTRLLVLCSAFGMMSLISGCSNSNSEEPAASETATATSQSDSQSKSFGMQNNGYQKPGAAVRIEVDAIKIASAGASSAIDYQLIFSASAADAVVEITATDGLQILQNSTQPLGAITAGTRMDLQTPLTAWQSGFVNLRVITEDTTGRRLARSFSVPVTVLWQPLPQEKMGKIEVTPDGERVISMPATP